MGTTTGSGCGAEMGQHDRHGEDVRLTAILRAVMLEQGMNMFEKASQDIDRIWWGHGIVSMRLFVRMLCDSYP